MEQECQSLEDALLMKPDGEINNLLNNQDIWENSLYTMPKWSTSKESEASICMKKGGLVSGTLKPEAIKL